MIKTIKNNITFLILNMFIVVFLFFTLSAQAVINKQINYQGKLFNSNEQPVNDGDYNMEFRLCSTSDCTGGSDPLWTETRTGANKVTVKTGLFSVLLGEVTSLNSVDFNQDLWLGVNIGGTGAPSWDGEMTPRKKLGAVNASIVSASLKSDVDGNTIQANSANNLLEITQTGSGNIFRVNDEIGDTSPFLIDADGNVGIGDTTPDALLDVAGSFRLDGTFGDKDGDVGTAGQILSSTVTGTDWIDANTIALGSIDLHSDVDTSTIAPSNGDLLSWDGTNWVTTSPTNYTDNIYTADGTLAGDRTVALNGNNLYFTGSGNVGIGTTSPGVKLRVNGQTRATSFRSANGTAGSPAYRFDSDTNTGMFRAGTDRLAFTTGGNERMRIDNNGDVGIGTGTPDSRLQVNGDAHINKDLLVGDSEIIYTEHEYKDSGLGGETLNWNLLQTQKTDDPNDKDFATITSGTGWKQQYPLTRWKIGDEGSNGQHYGYTGYFPGDNWDPLFRVNTAGDDKTDLALGVMTKDVINITASDFYVGIHENSPTQLLDVNGNMRLRKAFYDGNNQPGTAGQILSSTASGTDWIDTFAPSAGTSLNNTLRWNGTAWVESTAFQNDDTNLLATGNITVNGNVLAGSPSSDLGSTTQGFDNIYSDLTQGSVLFIGSNGLLTEDNPNFFWDNGNNRLGIGTSSADYSLDVSGEMGVDRHIYHNGDANTYIDFTPDRIRMYAGGRSMIDMRQNNNRVVFNEGSAQIDFRFEGGTEQNLLFLDASTDLIGIGTNAPSQILDVVGNIELNDYLYFRNGSSEYLRHDNSTFIMSDDLLPSTDDSLDLGSSSYRWQDLYLGPQTLHIGTSLTDEGLIGYDTTNNILTIETDSTTNGDVAINTDDLFIDTANSKVGIGTTTPDEELQIAGNMRLDGAFEDKDGDKGTTGQVLSSTATGTDWITNSSNPIPFIEAMTPTSVPPSSTTTVTLSGHNFTPTSAVAISGGNTVNSVNILSPVEIEVDVTAVGTIGDYDIVISNNGVLNTQWTNNGVGLFKVASLDGTTQARAGESCKSILDDGYSTGDGTYWINPDGGSTSNAFQVYCDMTTSGGGWTRIEYAADLPHQNQFGGDPDTSRWLNSDFTLTLTDTQINDIRAVSTEGKQTYVGTCDGVIHYNYNSGNYAYAFGFRFHNGDETAYEQQTYPSTNINVTADGCSSNNNSSTDTIFEIQDVRVPVINVHSRDNGAGEEFGSPLTNNPAWLR